MSLYSCATLRRKAKEQWYNGNYSDDKPKKGGPWNAQYRKFILDAAAKEKQVDGALLPGVAASIGGSSWASIGPTGSNFIKNGSVHLSQTDSGRTRNIVLHPTIASTLHLAKAAGRVWKTTNGGTSWAPNGGRGFWLLQ